MDDKTGIFIEDGCSGCFLLCALGARSDSLCQEFLWELPELYIELTASNSLFNFEIHQMLSGGAPEPSRRQDTAMVFLKLALLLI